MIAIAGLSLIVTDKCNASCRHCGFAAGPAKKAVISLEQARAYLEALREQAGAMLVSYTGGEPFLYYEQLKEIISLAHQRGFYGEVVTNSFWARDIREARSMLQELHALGVVNFVTSLDEYHAEYIEPGCVKNAVFAATELGFNVTVKVTGSQKGAPSKYTPAFVQEYLSGTAGAIKVIGQYPIQAGRAVFSADASKSAKTASSHGRCPTVIRFPSINPYQEVYPCCGFGEKNRLLGNTSERPLNSILRDMQNNLFLNMLACRGPLFLLESASPYLKRPPRTNFGHICEICNYLCEDPEARAAVRCVLAQLAGDNHDSLFQEKSGAY